MTPDQHIQDIDDRIQALYREKERLEMERDASAAPALIKTLLELGARFVLDHCHHSRANIDCDTPEADSMVSDAVRVYIDNDHLRESKPISGEAGICGYRSETPYIYAVNAHGKTDEEIVAATLRVLRALGIPRDRISTADYEREVANHERNRARVQVDLDKVRALVEAY